MRSRAKKTKLDDLSRYISKCIYCEKEIYSDHSFVALVKTLEPITYVYAHYQCMKDDDHSRAEDKTFEQHNY
tara:strand:- start:2910 stop:3125 length:216 start_codon:yes stop_codon:yes gene_type:complete